MTSRSDAEEITLRLNGDLLDAIDRYVEERGRHEARSRAVLSALREWAHAKGYVAEPGEEGIRPEDLSAANDD
jgi:hypothetical protein